MEAHRRTPSREDNPAEIQPSTTLRLHSFILVVFSCPLSSCLSTDSVMRTLSRLPWGFPARPRVPLGRPQISQASLLATARTARLNSSSANSSHNEQRKDSGSSGSYSGSSNSWSAGRTLLISGLAAGAGYAGAVLSCKPQGENLKPPQYGTMQDFEKVGNGLFLSRI